MSVFDCSSLYRTGSKLQVLVVATMSAGKSSFLNALIGSEILHSANEATTACITSIEFCDCNDSQFSGACYTSSGGEVAHSKPVLPDTIQKWNMDPDVGLIRLECGFQPFSALPDGVVLYDTPGPNNSQDQTHAQLMLEAVRAVPFDMVFYILNATQIGTYDDRALLEQLRDEMGQKSNVPIYFILNKIDVLDPEMGESIEVCIKKIEIYLSDIGFSGPVIVPAMAKAALSARKMLGHARLTRQEKFHLHQVMEQPEPEKRLFLQSALVPEPVKARTLEMLDGLQRLHLKYGQNAEFAQQNELQQIVVASGLCTAEFLIRNQRQMVKDIMNTVFITHNPFTVETSFLFNGRPPADGCKLSSYRESRLQVWVEKLFEELSILFNGDNHFQIEFKGIESDYLDIQDAAQKARAEGMQVELTWIETSPAEQRLEQIRGLIDEAYQNPSFSQFIKNDEQIDRSLKEAFNRDFDVYVVATMSSGKSTLINAMLGCDLLPSGNEATTATIARITDNDQMKGRFIGKCRNGKGEQTAEDDNLTLERMREWNASPDIREIDVEGDIIAIRERDEVRLVLTDTPGPNNSQDEEHQRVTMEFIQDSRRNPLILYVLNATQLGTNDDKNLLGLIAEIMRKGGKQSKDRFIFVVNKMDAFDPESGEDIPKVLARVRQYLVSNGIPNPQLYPVSANLTRLIRKPSDRQTRSERGEYAKMADLFSEEPSMDMLQYMPVTSVVHRTLEEKGYSRLMLASGLPAVETMIDEYIDKYNLPHRLKRVHDAITQAITVGLNEAGLIEQLDQDQHTLDQLNTEINELEKRQKKGFDTAAYQIRLEREGMLLPAETEEKLTELEGSAEPLIRELDEQSRGKTVSETSAKIFMDGADATLSFHYKKLFNAYEALFNSTQELIRKDLYEQYQLYVADLFEGTAKLDLPILEGLKRAVSNISFNLSIREGEIKPEQVETGSREVSDSTWWNPFSWGRTKIVKEYEMVDSVDLEAAWKERVTRIDARFKSLVKEARTRIEVGKNTLVDDYVQFMDREFNEKFKELMISLKEKTEDKTAREQAIAKAKKDHAWIENFKSKLDSTLAV